MDKDIELTRRKMLAGLGTVGIASAGTGLGTTAYFSDEETFKNNTLTAGELDLKVDWQEHYSDWSIDENDDRLDDAGDDEFDEDLDGDGSDDFEVVMTDGDSDKVPAGYVGFPTFEEPLVAVPEAAVDDFLDNTAIEAYPDEDGDGIKDLIRTRNQIATQNPTLDPDEVEEAFHDQFADVPDDLDRPVIEITDAKPGDFGEVTFSTHLHNNPGYLWLQGDLLEASENGTTEPERNDPDEGEGVELLDEIQVAIWYDDGDNVRENVEIIDSPHDIEEPSSITLGPSDSLIDRGTLREVLEDLGDGLGIPLDADPTSDQRECYPFSSTYYVGFAWWLPVDHANEIQTDSVEFDLGFYTEQCRHNDGSGMAPEKLLTLTSGSPQGQGAGFANPWDVSETLSHRGSGSWGTVDQSPAESYKQGFYFGGQFSEFGVLPAFTVSEIEELSYWLYEPTALNGVDIYLNIYTQPENDGDDTSSWYDSRLQALPAQANGGSPNFTPGKWNKFSTSDSGSNTLSWSDTGRGGNFVQPLPTFETIQSGPIDWSTLGGNLSITQDYRDETVLALSLQTGSVSGVSLEAYIDDIEVRLTDGSRLVLDLEP